MEPCQSTTVPKTSKARILGIPVLCIALIGYETSSLYEASFGEGLTGSVEHEVFGKNKDFAANSV